MVRYSGRRLLAVRRIAVLIPSLMCLALGSLGAAAQDRQALVVTSKAAAAVSALHTDALPIVRQTVADSLPTRQSATAERPASIQATGADVVPVTTLTSAQLAAMPPRKGFLLVNVHIPYEGEIDGTDAFIPYDKIADNLHRLPKDRDEPIVLYCRSGRMSEIAANELVRLGYARVFDLAGGMIEWKKSGFEVIER